MVALISPLFLLSCIFFAHGLPVGRYSVPGAWPEYPDNASVSAGAAGWIGPTRESKKTGPLRGLLELSGGSQRQAPADSHITPSPHSNRELFRVATPSKTKLPESTFPPRLRSSNSRISPRTAPESNNPDSSLILCHILKLSPTSWEDYIDVIAPQKWSGSRIVDGVHVEHVAADAWTGWLQFTSDGRPVMMQGYEEEAKWVTVLCLGSERPLTPVAVEMVETEMVTKTAESMSFATTSVLGNEGTTVGDFSDPTTSATTLGEESDEVGVFCTPDPMSAVAEEGPHTPVFSIPEGATTTSSTIASTLLPSPSPFTETSSPVSPPQAASITSCLPSDTDFSSISCLSCSPDICAEVDIKTLPIPPESPKTDVRTSAPAEPSETLKGNTQWDPITSETACSSTYKPCIVKSPKSGLKASTLWDPVTGEPVCVPCGTKDAIPSNKPDSKAGLRPTVPNAPYKDPKAGTFDIPALKPVKKPEPSAGSVVDSCSKMVDSSHFDSWTGEHIGRGRIRE